MTPYYQPSGKFSFSSFAFLLAACLTAIPLFGFIYAYAIWYIPFIYINFLIAAGFGFLIGLATSYTAIGWGKVRNGKVALLLGLIAGIVGLYEHWCVWLSLVLNAGESYGNSRLGVTVSNASFSQTLLLMLQPKQVFALIGAVNETGTWGIRTATVSGIFLTIIWCIEAVIVVGIPALIVYSASQNPFMESINEWAKEKELPAFSFIEDTSAFKEALEKNDFGVLNQLTQVSKEVKEKDHHSIFTLFSYPGHNEYYLTVANKIAKRDEKDKNKISFDEVKLVDNLAIDQKMGELLLNLKGAEVVTETNEAIKQL